MKPKKVKSFNLQEFIIKELRRAFKRSPMYTQARNKAKHDFFVDSKTGKPMRRVHYQCAQCKQFFLGKGKDDSIAVDHIVPIIEVDQGFVDYNKYVTSLYCSLDNLQVLCNFPKREDGTESCHKVKTRLENQARKRKS